MKRIVWSTVFLLGALLLVASAQASSHREAPGITKTPKVDGSDFYMFNSYEATRDGFVTLIANYLPLQDPYGGPNFFALDHEAVYRILIDNDGDGVEDITFQFKFGENFRDIRLPVGGKSISVPFINIGTFNNNDSSTLNRAESYTVRVIRGPIDGRGQGAGQSLFNADTGGTRFGKPVDNIGERSTPNYPDYAKQFIYNVTIPGCASPGRLFVGQRRDGFAVNLGETFDLLNISNPLGPRDAEPNSLSAKNVTTIALEVSKSCLTKGQNPVIGGWTTTALPRRSVLLEAPDFASTVMTSGEYVQVSRLGVPLINEVFIGLKDKNRFNNSTPNHDRQFADYVTNPTLPAILEIFYGSAGVKAPTNFPRTDLVAAFLTGIAGLNQLGGPAEELRLNTSIPAVAPAAQSNLGLLGGDTAGFPNGRRPGDDVVDIELRLSMGVLCHAFPGVYCSPAAAPSGALPFTDGTLQDVSQFDNFFPYLRSPIPGSPNEEGSPAAYHVYIYTCRGDFFACCTGLLCGFLSGEIRCSSGIDSCGSGFSIVTIVF